MGLKLQRVETPWLKEEFDNLILLKVNLPAFSEAFIHVPLSFSPDAISSVFDVATHDTQHFSFSFITLINLLKFKKQWNTDRNVIKILIKDIKMCFFHSVVVFVLTVTCLPLFVRVFSGSVKPVTWRLTSTGSTDWVTWWPLRSAWYVVLKGTVQNYLIVWQFYVSFVLHLETRSCRVSYRCFCVLILQKHAFKKVINIDISAL